MDKKKLYELHANICKTFSNPKRLEMIDLLRTHLAMTVNQIAKAIGITQTNASQHLSLLRHYHIVKTRRRSNTISYSLTHSKILMAYDAVGKILQEQLRHHKQFIK